MATPDPAARYLPPGLPVPDREAMASLRANVMLRSKTPHPPEAAELAAIIVADEAGIDLAEVDAEAVWAQPPEARAPIFEAIARLLGEVVGG
jgi:hypothetical protein